jgi:tetratricopeptide (TPR) repeat protein
VRVPDSGRRSARTVLDAKIRERNMTLAEFVEYAETFARDTGETGTLSLRHLQRLIEQADNGQIRHPRPATCRLLECILGAPIGELLQPIHATAPTDAGDGDNETTRLVRNIDASRRVDDETIRLFADQVETTRRLDRRFGAGALLGALRFHAQHMEELLHYGIAQANHGALAAVLTDAHTLAGWQSLDRGEIRSAWNHYRHAFDAAHAAESPALHAHALAEQAVVLADIGRTAEAAQMSARARAIGGNGSPLLQAWLAAAHGEALAGTGDVTASLRAFDDAHALLPAAPQPAGDGPYVALDVAHLARWRGNALARFGHPDAVTVLTAALDQHDTEFTRAEAGLRTDLVLAHLTSGEHDAARTELATARRIADVVGSTRQRRRLEVAARGVA